MCRKATESVSHILASCGALVQTKYLSRHNKTVVKANRIDATIVDKESETVAVLEMSCPWIQQNREEKTDEKTAKYEPLRWELKQRFPKYKVTQYNIIIDVLGGYSKDVIQALKQLVGEKSNAVALQMKKAVLTSTLKIARTFLRS